MTDLFLQRAKIETNPKPVATFRLRDYLKPGGLYRYEDLAPDLQSAFDAGYTVYLYSVPGFMMVAGHPENDGDETDETPWHVCDFSDRWERTAVDALKP
jgi:hypothetical protein